MVAESHVFNPQLPSYEVVQQVTQYCLEREVRQVNWSDKWRHLKDKETHPEDWLQVFCEGKTLAEIQDAIKQAGFENGSLNGRSPYEVKDLLEQILNGVSNFGSD